jgi:hypothetical protein
MREDKLVILASIQGRWFLLMSHHISHPNMNATVVVQRRDSGRKACLLEFSGRGGTQSEIRKRVSPIKSVRVASRWVAKGTGTTRDKMKMNASGNATVAVEGGGY